MLTSQLVRQPTNQLVELYVNNSGSPSTSKPTSPTLCQLVRPALHGLLVLPSPPVELKVDSPGNKTYCDEQDENKKRPSSEQFSLYLHHQPDLVGNNQVGRDVDEKDPLDECFHTSYLSFFYTTAI